MNTTKVQTKVMKAPELRPSIEEFAHPIKYLSRPEIEHLGKKFGILKVIPPEGWKPNFSLDWDGFKFHTRIQRLHELNLRNRSRACFVEGFNCYLESRGYDPLPIDDNLCLGVSDDSKRSEKGFADHLNGWFRMKDGGSVHIHDIFLTKEYRKWFYRILDNEKDRELLKKLSTYCRYLLKVLKLESSDEDTNEDVGDLVIPPEMLHTTLRELLKSPAALLKRPDNKLRLQKMRKRLMTSIQKRGGRMRKRHKVDNMLTPPMDSIEFEDSYETEKDGKLQLPLTPDILAPETLEEACTICYNTDSPDSTLICDGCERVFHMKCLPIPLEKVPKYDWFCGGCLAGSTSSYAEYGFEEEFENMFSLREFSNYCRTWEIQLINMIKNDKLHGMKIELSQGEIDSFNLSESTIEKLFWNFTNGQIAIPEGLESMKIRYGADIHNEKAGEVSGFPTADNPRRKPEDDEYINSEWNLNRLPFAQGSLLDYICDSLSEENEEKDEKEVKNQISGMTVPWVYIGGPLSTFCWHKEDHYTLSANYSHFGAPKKWYGIPAKDSFKFEGIVNKIAPEYEAKQKDLMHQLVSMISPDEIHNHGEVAVYETVQRPGEFIVTFPKVYHSGFNYGFNVNEAVNFTLPLWVPFSIPAVKEYEVVGKECVFDTFKLLKKVYFDLNSEKGRRKWKENTGINDEKVNELIIWVNEAYNREVHAFEEVILSQDVSEVLQNMPGVTLKEYSKDCILGRAQSDDEGEEDADNDKLCVDCKTRVHFQWAVIDIYEDWKRKQERDVAAAEKGKQEISINETQGLGIGYKDIESEWKDIIKKAREKSFTDSNEIKIRRSSRKRKSTSGGEAEIQEGERKIHQDISDASKERTEMYRAMHALRKDNSNFGKCVLCVRCLREEVKKLSDEEKERVCLSGYVVTE